MTRDEIIAAGIQFDAGIVRLDALRAYLDDVRQGCADAVLHRTCTPSDADWNRGRAAACRDLITLITPQPENP